MTELHASHVHNSYRMSCEQFDELVARGGGACGLCGLPWDDVAGRPVIDHDHYLYDGTVGVRGLICAKCNAHMRHVDSGQRQIDERTRAYLDDAWHLTAALNPGIYRIRNRPSPRQRRRMKLYSFNAPEALLDQARATATAQGDQLSSVLRDFMAMYVRLAGPKEPPATD